MLSGKGEWPFVLSTRANPLFGAAETAAECAEALDASSNRRLSTSSNSSFTPIRVRMRWERIDPSSGPSSIAQDPPPADRLPALNEAQHYSTTTLFPSVHGRYFHNTELYDEVGC